MLAALALAACSNPRYEKASKRILQCEKQLESYQKQLQQIDTTKLAEIHASVELAIDTLEELAIRNTWILEKEEAEYLTNYKSLAAPARQLSKKAQILQEEMQYSENQLANLQTDIQNKALPIDSVLLYLSQEEKALGILKLSTKNLVDGNEVLMARYQLLHPQYSYYFNRINKR